MNIITPKNLSGFMELVPKEQVLFEKIKQNFYKNTCQSL